MQHSANSNVMQTHAHYTCTLTHWARNLIGFTVRNVAVTDFSWAAATCQYRTTCKLYIESAATSGFWWHNSRAQVCAQRRCCDAKKTIVWKSSKLFWRHHPEAEFDNMPRACVKVKITAACLPLMYIMLWTYHRTSTAVLFVCQRIQHNLHNRSQISSRVNVHIHK